MAQCLLPADGSLLHGRGSSTAHPVSLRPPTGEPDAGNPPVRFGGRGRLTTSPYPYKVVKRAFARGRVARNYLARAAPMTIRLSAIHHTLEHLRGTRAAASRHQRGIRAAFALPDGPLTKTWSDHHCAFAGAPVVCWVCRRLRWRKRR